MKKIDIEEIHKRLLSIATCFHEICCKNGIPYYMLGGTMLGAYRHKGFIPWDDDMDFGVPIDDYERMIEVMNSDLPSKYICTTFQNNPGNRCSYVKIMDSTTLIEDYTNRLPLKKQLGVNIDVVPLVNCDKDSPAIKHLFFLRRLTRLVYYEPTDCGIIKKSIKRILRFTFPISQDKMLRKIQRNVIKCHKKNGKYCGSILGAWGAKEIVPKDIMGQPKLYPFEGIQLYGASQPELYLTSLYGQGFMKPPPEGDLHIHLNNAYVI